MHDALRFARSNKVLVAVAVLSLAVGIGATASAYSTLNWLLNGAPHGVFRPEELVTVKVADTRNPQLGTLGFTFKQFGEYRLVQDTFTDVAAYGKLPGVLATESGGRQIVLQFVTGNYFPLLGMRPAQGRLFDTSDDDKAAAVPVVLSHRVWTSVFLGDAEAVGRSIRVNGTASRIVGVAPAEFEDYHLDWSGPTGAWVPLSAAPFLGQDGLTQGNSPFVLIMGRLRPGNTLTLLDQKSASWLNGLTPAAAVGAFKPTHFVNTPSSDYRIGRKAQAKLFFNAFIGVSFLVLLAACSCAANLVVGNLIARRRELALRSALGAGRTRLLTQVTSEVGTVGCLAAIAGVGIAYLIVQVLAQAPRSYLNLPASFAAFDTSEAFDRSLLLFAGGLALGATVLFGLIPALLLIRRDSFAGLRTRSGVASKLGGMLRPRHVILVAQLAFAVWCGTVAASQLSSVARIASIRSGFNNASATIAMRVAPVAVPGTAAEGFWRDLRSRTSALPGVKSAALSGNAPFTMGLQTVRLPDDQRTHQVAANTASSGYFSTQGVALVTGREFDDSAADQEGAVIINAVLARTLFPDGSPVGRRVVYGATERSVVGVVAIERCRDLLGPAGPCAWRPVVPSSAPSYLSIHGSTDFATLVKGAREALRVASPDSAISEEMYVSQIIGELTARQRLTALVATGLAGCAILLSLVGAIALFVSVARAEERDNAVRIALGARPLVLARRLATHLVLIAVVGAVGGMAAARWTASYLADQLYQTTASDWRLSGTVAMAIIAIATAVVFLSTRRAVTVDPVITLRTS